MSKTATARNKATNWNKLGDEDEECNSPRIVIEETNGIEWRKIKNEYKCSQGKTLIAHGQGNSANTNSNFSGELGLALSIALELWADYHTTPYFYNFLLNKMYIAFQ